MIYNLDLFGIGDSIVQACRTFVGWIAVMIYTLIEYMYHVFELLGRTEIIEDSYVRTIYSRVGMILGIFMVFKLVFSLVQSLIEPEKLNDKKNGYGQIIKRCVISIVLLGITPSLFREAFSIQNYIIGSSSKDNVIYKLIAGSSSHNKGKIGRQLAGNLFFDFVTDTEEPKLKEGMIDDFMVSADGTTSEDSIYIERFQENNWDNFSKSVLSEQKDFSDAIDYLAVKNNGKYVIELNWFPLLVVGGTVLYIIALYCVQVAVRVVQLAYLQLIAPIPILSYISDPEGSFKKWTKQCLTTYLDLFIRLAIIYFVMTVISEVLEQFENMSGIIYDSAGLANEKWHAVLLVKAFIIIGLLLFGKKVPELIKDLFPNLGGGAAGFGFGLGLKKNLLDPLKDVGKSLYNTPLGWGLKGGKKLGTYIDRKAHHLPKPRGKFGQAVDKWLPGRGEAIKQRRQAQEEERQFDNNMKQGKRMYDRFAGDLVEKDAETGEITGVKSGAFSHRDYANSYLDVERAKAENKKAEQEYQTEYAKYQAAYSRGDQDAIEQAENRIRIAEKNKKVAAGKLELAQNKHNVNKKIYADDAKREETYDYYKKTHGKATEYESKPKVQNNQSTSTTSQNNQQPQSTNNQHQSSSNTPSSVFGNVENYGEDGNPYEAGYSQFTADKMSGGNNNSTYGNDDGNPYETGHGQFNTTGANNSEENDNPYTNPNYYNNSSQNSSSNNNNDEFDGSNYY